MWCCTRHWRSGRDVSFLRNKSPVYVTQHKQAAQCKPDTLSLSTTVHFRLPSWDPVAIILMKRCVFGNWLTLRVSNISVWLRLLGDIRQMHVRLMCLISGVCICCLASNGTNLSITMVYVWRLTKQPKLTAIIQSCQLTLFGHTALHGWQRRC